jgi:hypothetical protein
VYPVRLLYDHSLSLEDFSIISFCTFAFQFFTWPFLIMVAIDRWGLIEAFRWTQIVDEILFAWSWNVSMFLVNLTTPIKLDMTHVYSYIWTIDHEIILNLSIFRSRFNGIRKCFVSFRLQDVPVVVSFQFVCRSYFVSCK